MTPVEPRCCFTHESDCRFRSRLRRAAPGLGLGVRPFRYHVLSRDPPILCYLGVDSIKTDLGVPPLPASLRPVVLLEYPLSWQGARGAMERVLKLQRTLADQGIEHHFMVNTGEEDELRRDAGVRGAHLSQNAFVNEHIFRPEVRENRYDAIYIAGMYRVKRHELARDVARLYVVTYNGRDFHTFCPQLSHAEFNREYLRPEAVAALINSSSVGLCLSAREGAMFASMEYLLCGVPVVTTPSRGGREEFFNPGNARTVPPQSQAVAEAVAAWCREPPRADAIRSGALAQINGIRRRFCDYVANTVERYGADPVDRDALAELYYGEDLGIAARAVVIKQLDSELATFRFDSPTVVPERVKGYRQRADGERLHLQSKAGFELSCDAPGAVIWQLCDNVNSVGEIAVQIAEAYSENPTMVVGHVRATLRQFARHGLIV